MSFYHGWQGATITPEGRVYYTPIGWEVLHMDEVDCIESPLSKLIDLPLKVTMDSLLTDDNSVSCEGEVNEYATCLFLDVEPDSVYFGHATPPKPLYGNVTVARVDSGELHPFVLEHIFRFTGHIVEQTNTAIDEARTRGQKADQKRIGASKFASEVFYEVLEDVRYYYLHEGKQPEWEVVRNPFRKPEEPWEVRSSISGRATEG